MKNSKIYLYLLLLLSSPFCIGQNYRECADEILKSEIDLSKGKDTAFKNKNIFLSYSVKVIDWENQTTFSNIKLYKNDNNIHLFSEQASMFNDSKEVVLILPGQKLIVLSSIDKQLNNLKQTDQFLKMRKSFLDSCDIVKCENKNDKTKTLILKVKKFKMNKDVNITDIEYEYDISSKKIVSVKTNYDKNYKIKQMTVVYKELDLLSTYNFLPAQTYLRNKKGSVLEKYKDYEIVDHRDETITQSKSPKTKH